MKRFFLIIFFGFLVWIVYFGASFFAEPLAGTNPGLFSALRFLFMLIPATFFLVIYFKKVLSGFAGEGLLIGLIWLGLSLLLDWFFNSGHGYFSNYFLSQGLIFFSIPIISSGFDLIVKRKIW